MKTISPKKLGKYLNALFFGISLVAVLSMVYGLGFSQPPVIRQILYWVYLTAIGGGAVSTLSRYIFTERLPSPKVRAVDAFLFLFLALLLLQRAGWVNIPVLAGRPWLYASILLIFIREFSALNVDFYHEYLNPAQLFIASFISIILIGAFLLILPKATYSGISFIDALFTSTSAVCVTGLIVVDTGSYFTEFGQWVVILLIQAGGIGIMTFTSYFSYFFRGGSSYENQLLLKDMANLEKAGEVFSTLKKIILLTFIIETIGAGVVFLSLEESPITSTSEKVFFSIFHSVSAFCNAGFSTLENSLFEPGYRFLYPLHITIAILFIIGGIGFPIAFNFFKYLKHIFYRQILRVENHYLPWIININTRIVLATTSILLLSGTALFYFFEYNNTLAEHRGVGKLATAFFGAATPRTAGFNSIDTAALNLPTLMIVFLL
ncbi:MAG: hypothetical protein KDC85_23570, partial [Saprospiraceae bacterium]|nr:hypothetical protein [Saprospiraceae bacterium]